MHTQTDFLERVDAQGGKTVLTVKKNQPTLSADLTTYFTDPLATYEQDRTCDYQRGRIERRSRKVTTAMNAYLSHWPHLAQVAQLTRTGTVRSTNKTTEEVVYLITDLDPTAASPGRLLTLVRGHWTLENSLQYVRDVTFGEDRSQLRSGNAPHIMAALRNLVITLIHRQGANQIADTRRQFSYHPQQALKLLLHKRRSKL